MSLYTGGKFYYWGDFLGQVKWALLYLSISLYKKVSRHCWKVSRHYRRDQSSPEKIPRD